MENKKKMTIAIYPEDYNTLREILFAIRLDNPGEHSFADAFHRVMDVATGSDQVQAVFGRIRAFRQAGAQTGSDEQADNQETGDNE